jgi:hypothetical protein
MANSSIFAMQPEGRWQSTSNRKPTSFTAGSPRQIFAAPGVVRPLDTAPDGRILVMLQADQGISPPIALVLNRDAELKK